MRDSHTATADGVAGLRWPQAVGQREWRERRVQVGGSGYLALYRIDGPRVVILAVRHGRELGY